MKTFLVLLAIGAGGFVIYSYRHGTPGLTANDGKMPIILRLAIPQTPPLMAENDVATEAAYNQYPTEYYPAYSLEGPTDNESVDSTFLQDIRPLGLREVL